MIEQQIKYYKNKHNHIIRLDMIIAIAEKCDNCYTNKPNNNIYITFFYNFKRQWSQCEGFCVYFDIDYIISHFKTLFGIISVFCDLAVPLLINLIQLELIV